MEYKNQINPEKAHRGHPIDKTAMRGKEYIGELPEESGELEVWVHHLQDILFTQEYAVSSIFTKVVTGFRILDQEGWREADYYERGVLNAVYRKLYKEVLAPYMKFQVRGIYYRGNLRIIDEKHQKGQQINTMRPDEIISYLRKFKVPPPAKRTWEEVFKTMRSQKSLLQKEQVFKLLTDKMRSDGVLYDFNM